MSHRLFSRRFSRPLLDAAVAGILAAGIAVAGAFGQELGRRETPPLFWSGNPSVMTVMMIESARLEVGVTSEQMSQFQKFKDERRERSRKSGADFRSMPEDELRQHFEKQRLDEEANLKSILKPEQYARLQQIAWHLSGPIILVREETLSAEFQLSDRQKRDLFKVSEEFRARPRESFRMSDEERAKRRADDDAKVMAVLTPAQQQQWKEKVGPAPKEEERPATSEPRIIVEERQGRWNAWFQNRPWKTVAGDTPGSAVEGLWEAELKSREAKKPAAN
jgi:hypothetical protein